MKTISIAIDGYSACGKSTLAKDLSNTLKYNYIDSGAMYRAVTLFAIQNKIISGAKINKALLLEQLSNIEIKFDLDADNRNTIVLNGQIVSAELRSMEVSEMVSEIATISEVRKLLVKIQQKMGEKKSIVMDGRDIGTVVFPAAELKLFLIADIEVRVQRRFIELQNKNNITDIQQIRENLLHRDYIDSTRHDSPLMQAPDAIVIDNSKLTKTQQLEFALSLAHKIINE
jgi:cytidylate kinase